MGSHSVTCHPTQVNAPRLNPSQGGRYSIYRPRRDGRLSWPRWLGNLGTYQDGLPVRRQSPIQVLIGPILSINYVDRSRRRANHYPTPPYWIYWILFQEIGNVKRLGIPAPGNVCPDRSSQLITSANLLFWQICCSSPWSGISGHAVCRLP